MNSITNGPNKYFILNSAAESFFAEIGIWSKSKFSINVEYDVLQSCQRLFRNTKVDRLNKLDFKSKKENQFYYYLTQRWDGNFLYYLRIPVKFRIKDKKRKMKLFTDSIKSLLNGDKILLGGRFYCLSSDGDYLKLDIFEQNK